MREAVPELDRAVCKGLGHKATGDAVRLIEARAVAAAHIDDEAGNVSESVQGLVKLFRGVRSRTEGTEGNIADTRRQHLGTEHCPSTGGTLRRSGLPGAGCAPFRLGPVCDDVHLAVVKTGQHLRYDLEKLLFIRGLCRPRSIRRAQRFPIRVQLV